MVPLYFKNCCNKKSDYSNLLSAFYKAVSTAIFFPHTTRYSLAFPSHS